jgi:hypothetical protein
MEHYPGRGNGRKNRKNITKGERGQLHGKKRKRGKIWIRLAW